MPMPEGKICRLDKDMFCTVCDKCKEKTMAIKKRLKIEVNGDDTQDMEIALSIIKDQVLEGKVDGGDSGDGRSYWFQVYDYEEEETSSDIFQSLIDHARRDIIKKIEVMAAGRTLAFESGPLVREFGENTVIAGCTQYPEGGGLWIGLDDGYSKGSQQEIESFNTNDLLWILRMIERREYTVEEE